MATLQEVKELALHVARGTAPTNFSVDSVNKAYADEIDALCGNLNSFMKNRYDVYQIIAEVADDIVPKKTLEVFGQFSEIKFVGQGERAMFKRGRLGKNRAKKFLTQVGLSGVYETFRLDTDTFEVRAHAHGSAVRLDYERFLDGAENIAELMDIVTEGLTEVVYLEVQKALIGAYTSQSLPTANVAHGNTFDAKEMQRLITIAKAYGNDAVIFAAPEFIDAMGPDAIIPGFLYPKGSLTPNAGMQPIVHPDDIDAIHFNGRIKIFRGTPIVEIPQSFVDENNEQVYINPAYAYILPTGGDKIVKIVFEGSTQMWDFTNTDRSMEIEIYRKLGVGILSFNNWCIYKNDDLDPEGSDYVLNGGFGFYTGNLANKENHPYRQ